jgi:CDP-2,3-bis-(O-geranylgeranyl)-sn-glycerol synthase
MLLFAIWIFLPAGIANASPVFAGRFKWLHPLLTPIDSGKRFRGRMLFGTHKTWAGLILACLSGTVIGALQWLAYSLFGPWDFLREVSIYNSSTAIFFGFALGLGAIIGDLVRSFFKRQFGIQSGGTWFPFDQIDYVIGGLLFSRLFLSVTIAQYIVIFCIWFLLHPITNIIGWRLGIRERPI